MSHEEEFYELEKKKVDLEFYDEQIDEEEKKQNKKLAFWICVIIGKFVSGIIMWHFFGDWITKKF